MKKNGQLRLVFSELRSNWLYPAAWGLISTFLIFIYFAFRKSSLMGYYAAACLEDYIHFLNDTYMFKLLFIPVSVLAVFLTLERDNTANRVIRYGSRALLVIGRQIKAFFLCFCFAIYGVGVSCLLAGLFTDRVGNWNETDSYFFMTRGYGLNIHTMSVIMWNLYKLFILLLFFSFLLIFLCTLFKAFLAFSAMLFLLGINIIGFLQYSLTLAINVSSPELSYFLPEEQILYLLIFPAFTALLFVVSLKTARRKEFLRS